MSKKIKLKGCRIENDDDLDNWVELVRFMIKKMKYKNKLSAVYVDIEVKKHE